MKPISALLVALIVMLMPALGTVSAQRTVDLDQVTIADVNAAFAKGTLTSERLVQTVPGAHPSVRSARARCCGR